MPEIVVRCECGKFYNVPESKAGKRFKCAGCGASLTAEAPAAAPKPEPAAAKPEPADASAAKARPRAERPAAARRAQEPKKSNMPLIAGGALVVVLAAGGAFYMMKGGDAKPQGAPDVAANTPKPEAPKPEPPKPKDPREEKKAEVAKRVAAAEKDPKAAAILVDVAIFCFADPKLEDEGKKIYEKVLGLDADNEKAREALGYKKYSGENPSYAGQWVTSEIFVQLSEEDAKKKQAAEARKNDPFVKAAESTIAEMKEMVAEVNSRGKSNAEKIPPGGKESDTVDPEKPQKSDAVPMEFEYFYKGDERGSTEVPRPYLLGIERGGARKPELYAADFGEILGALFRTFYERYGKAASLKALDSTPVPVWIFWSKGQYDRWRRSGRGGPSSSLARAFYSGTEKNNHSGILHLWLIDPQEDKTFSGNQIEEIRKVVWHEGTHQLMDFNSPGRGFDISNSPWMQEGFAEYVAGYERELDQKQPDGWRYFMGLPHAGRVTEYVSIGNLQNKGYDNQDELVKTTPSVREIATMSYAEFWTARAIQEAKTGGEEGVKAGKTVAGTYCIGWGLCHFLQHFEDGKYRSGFDQWLKSELHKHNGELPGDVFQRIFGLDSDEKWNQFELDFQNYLLFKLRKESKKVDARDPAIMKKYRAEYEAALAAVSKK